MAYNALNNLIDAYIYPNGVQAITGSILNNVLKAMVSQLGGGYNLMGVAAPASYPAVNDEPQAFFAATAGTYTNFGGIVLAAGEVAVLLTSGNGSWSKQTIYNVPTGTADLANTAGFITSAVNDLVNYYTKTEIDTALADYTTTAALATALTDYYNKDAIDAQMATRYTKSEVDTKLGEYYKKTETYDKDEVDSIVAALSRQEYIVAWDGIAAPDVSAIPAGVTVTYSGTPYTGTLAASASTVNKIYMVWNGTAYDMYGTSQDGGYSWVPMGTTTVDLSQYATKQEVRDLEVEKNLDIYGEAPIHKDYIWTDGFVASGTVMSSTLSKFCQPVLFKAGEKLTYKTGSTYASAVVQVADGTPIAVGSTGITVQVLINAATANTQYEYTFETDMWVVISVLKSDYVLNTYIYRANSISEQIDHIEEKVYPKFTSLPAVNACIDELYISGYKDGYYISYFYWTGSALTMIIRDSSDNIIWFANGMSVTVGEVFQLSQNGVTVYGILNSTTHLVSPVTASIGGKSLSLDENPQVGAEVLAPNVYYSPLCVSRFNLGALPDADHNASWLGIVRRCDEVNDSVFCFANKMAPAVSNHFFDFYEVGTHARGVPYVAEMETYLDYSGKNGLSTSDALLMPLIVGAVNNADGDNLTEKWFTGGNHAYGNTATGSPTLREVSNTVRVDGVLVPVGRGGVRGRVCTVDLVDRIQGYNTCKENGGGREIIQENVHIVVTNDYIETTVEFVALESVIVYGPMYASGMNVENMVGYRFIGSQTKRGLYVYNGGNVPGNDDNAINAISIHTAGDYVFDTVLDLSYGQGNKLMSGAPNCFVTTSKKAYFVVIPTGTQVSLDEGGSICYRTRLYFRKK